MRKLPVLFKFVVFRQSLVVNLKVQLSFTVSLDCLVNKNNVFLFVYSINILPLTVKKNTVWMTENRLCVLREFYAIT